MLSSRHPLSIQREMRRHVSESQVVLPAFDVATFKENVPPLLASCGDKPSIEPTEVAPETPQTSFEVDDSLVTPVQNTEGEGEAEEMDGVALEMRSNSPAHPVMCSSEEPAAAPGAVPLATPDSSPRVAEEQPKASDEEKLSDVSGPAPGSEDEERLPAVSDLAHDCAYRHALALVNAQSAHALNAASLARRALTRFSALMYPNGALSSAVLSIADGPSAGRQLQPSTREQNHEIRVLRVELAAQRDDYARIRKEMETTRVENMGLRVERNALIGKEAKRKADAAAHEAERQDLKNAVASLRAEATRLTAEGPRVGHELTRLHEENTRLAGENFRGRAETSQLRSQIQWHQTRETNHVAALRQLSENGHALERDKAQLIDGLVLVANAYSDRVLLSIEDLEIVQETVTVLQGCSIGEPLPEDTVKSLVKVLCAMRQPAHHPGRRQ
ncbi:unnamed protein product [Mycena citricolor]|uniref:Uncharacterized protein n=1 Tax=Mycena citricolor TaxID=2018698 RepID=A0AAD2JYK5_9AGAR|nr:unnamed protein product [Mycena citricolor]